MPTPTLSQRAIERVARRLCQSGRPGDPAYEREFAGLLTLLSPRISRLIRQYRLGDMHEDAQQAAAIGVHRALTTFDPAKAQFTTHVTWQIRGELQSLRHRMRLDQRRSAVAAGISTVSLEALSVKDEDIRPFEIVDDTALPRVESAASDGMAWSLMMRLLDQLEAPRHERAILHNHLFDTPRTAMPNGERTPEQCRQVVRRTLRNCAKVVAA